MMRRSVLTSLALLASVASTAWTTVARAEDVDACIEASNRALDQRNAEKLTESRTSLVACSEPACPDAVRLSCQKRLDEVNQAIPSVVFALKDGSGRDIMARSLAIDGQPYVGRLDGVIQLDPGRHDFVFQVDGQRPVAKTLLLRESEQNRHEEVVVGASAGTPPPRQDDQAQRDAELERLRQEHERAEQEKARAQADAAERARRAAADAKQKELDDEREEVAHGRAKRRTTGIVLAGIGLGFGAVAGTFWLLSAAEIQSIKSGGLSSSTLIQTTDDIAKAYGVIAVGTAVIGGGLVLIGAPLFFANLGSGTPNTGQVILSPMIGSATGIVATVGLQ
jgi:hypothetical protein